MAESRISKLCERQESILDRISSLEKLLSVAHTPSRDFRKNSAVEDPLGTAKKLGDELESKGIKSYCFVRTPSDYYEKDLEYRRTVLQAPSVDHLCKSIVMENTRVDGSEPDVIKYWLVIVQYTSRLDNTKLIKFVWNHHNGRLGRQKINMRLVSEAKSEELTGFGKNAVSPVGLRTGLPIILAQEIADLDPKEIWFGGGEVDLKLGMPTEEFIRAYGPTVIPLSS